ncbi:hypothetical protein [Symmachiella dynata]|uniref:hypothetical protein n=1 Tax=Symmachiella dynata TaxID=2527995 RepID=UPI0030EE9C91
MARAFFAAPLRTQLTLQLFRPLAVLFAMVLFSSTLTGCGDTSHGDRVPLTGTVKKGGELLQTKATIYFNPLPDQGGNGSSGEVAEGRFTIPAESGPTPGKKYNVSVITSPGIPADDTPRDQIKLPERLETTVEIPSRDSEDSPELEIVFD